MRVRVVFDALHPDNEGTEKDMPRDQARVLIATGRVVAVNEPVSARDVQPGEAMSPAPAENTPAAPERPPVSANKAAWVEWALDRDRDLDRGTAEGFTKDELIEQFGDHAADT